MCSIILGTFIGIMAVLVYVNYKGLKGELKRIQKRLDTEYKSRTIRRGSEWD